jgi:hypothetical protein
VFLFDESAFGNGKIGMVLTTETLYCRSHYEKSGWTVPLLDILGLGLLNENLSSQIYIQTVGKTYEFMTSQGDKGQRQVRVDFLEKVILATKALIFGEMSENYE